MRPNTSPALEQLEPRRLFAVTPNDPLFPQQAWFPQISLPQAWEFTTGSPSVVVNINDTGIDYAHPDLYKNLWLNQAEIPFAVGNKGLRDTDKDGLITFWDLNARSGGRLVNGDFASDVNANGYIDAGDLLNDPRWENGVDDGAGNGFVDDLIGWDFANDDNDPMDDNNHGTYSAGVIGELSDNGEGGAGMNWRVQMMATKGLDYKAGGGTAARLGGGLRYAADNGARVSNNSWGSTNMTKGDTERFTAAIDYAATKDMLTCFGAGNQSWDNDVDGPGRSTPASFGLPNIIAVAAVDASDVLADFSNYGGSTVHLAAPGVSIGTTARVAWNPSFPYQLVSGTSIATPFVTGTAALLLARNPNLSYGQLKDAILTNVDPIPGLAGTTISGGRLNVFSALAAVPDATASSRTASATFAAARTVTQVWSLFDSADDSEAELFA
jgi:subtilisin family serine protease